MTSPLNASTKWLRDTAERVLSSAAQAALAVMLTSSFGLLDVNSWAALAVAAGTAAVLTVVKALAATQVGDPSSASLNPKV